LDPDLEAVLVQKDLDAVGRNDLEEEGQKEVDMVDPVVLVQMDHEVVLAVVQEQEVLLR
jgi:hypothetical protein